MLATEEGKAPKIAISKDDLNVPKFVAILERKDQTEIEEKIEHDDIRYYVANHL